VARVLVPLATGFEEIEAVTVIDILRRAGIDVVVASLEPGPVQGSHGITIAADQDLSAVMDQRFDMVALPGGMPGAANLQQDARIVSLLQSTAGHGGVVAAICAAPMVLATAGLLQGHRATSYPGFLDSAAEQGTVISDEAVVSDGNRVTSRGPGTAMDFALALVENLLGRKSRQAVEQTLQRQVGSSETRDQ
jgi:4-methyl-5(b-hydroxyethyl)-thiazole monophosphate biosynthesis